MVRTFFRSRTAWVGLVLVIMVILVAALTPIWLTQPAVTLDLTHANQNPSFEHPFGTDRLGRDVLARVFVGSRLSLWLGVLATVISYAIGTIWGGATALLPTRVRSVMLGAIDISLAFPVIIVAIFVTSVIHPSAMGAAAAVGVAGAPSIARITSSLVLSIGGREYVLAARVIGVRWPSLLFRHILLNTAETIVLRTSYAIAAAITFIAGLSFLGLGVQYPEFDWGSILVSGVQSIYLNPAAALAPAAAILISSLALGLVGEEGAKAMNPLVWTAAGGHRKASHRPQPASLRTIGANGSERSMDPAPSDNLVLEVDDLAVSFPTGQGYLPAVNGVTFRLRKGEVLGIVGESGSGKSMTALAVAQLVPYPGVVTGRIKLNGRDVTRESGAKHNQFLATALAMVFQDPSSSMNPALHVGRQLTESAELHRGLSHQRAVAVAESRLAEMNMPAPTDQMHRYPHELSGGMRQRAMIAMGLMNEPALLIADEPTTALDVTIQAQIIELLSELNKRRQMAVILISHNMALISQICDRVLVMYAGQIVEELSTKQLLTRARHPYTQALLRAIPDVEEPPDVLESIPGNVPDLANVPDGCPFNPRCPLAVERCRHERPPLLQRPDGDQHRVACWVANDQIG